MRMYWYDGGKGGILLVQFFLIVGIVGIINSGVFIGAWVDGDRQRVIFIQKPQKTEIPEPK